MSVGGVLGGRSITRRPSLPLLCRLSARTIQHLVNGFGCHLNVELQQRGVEFSQLFTRHDALRPALLERMPPMEARASGRGLTNGAAAPAVTAVTAAAAPTVTAPAAGQTNSVRRGMVAEAKEGCGRIRGGLGNCVLFGKICTFLTGGKYVVTRILNVELFIEGRC